MFAERGEGSKVPDRLLEPSRSAAAFRQIFAEAALVKLTDSQGALVVAFG